MIDTPEEIIKEVAENYIKEIREYRAEIMEKTFGISVMWCPHCDEMIREGEICNSCNTVIESGIPACPSCKQEKIYSDSREEWFCPFHEEKVCDT